MFEDNLRRNKHVMATWLKYAKFEENQGDLERVRSIFERAIDVDYRNPQVRNESNKQKHELNKNNIFFFFKKINFLN